TFFMSEAGKGIVTDGGDSILQFERWRTTRDHDILEAIVRYNEEDCISTLKLRDWLLERKAEAERAFGVPIPWKAVETATVTPERAAEDEATRNRRERLLQLGDGTSILLGNLLGYHRREAKPEYWAYFDRRKKSPDDLV